MQSLQKDLTSILQLFRAGTSSCPKALHLLCTAQFVPQGHFTCFALPSSCRKGTSPALHCPVRAARALHLLCTAQFVPQGHFTCFALPRPVRAARALHLLCTAKVHRTFSVSPQPPDLLVSPQPCPSHLGKGFVSRNAKLRFGFVSQSPNSQNLSGRTYI